MESTNKLGSTLSVGTSGAIMPAVVKPATVAEPTATRITAVINQAKIRGCMSQD